MDWFLNVLGPLFWYVVLISVLITVHEFGHFWVARRAGVTVKRFSIGFGKPLWLRYGKDGTEYAVSMLPLGGYVSMLDDTFDEDPLPPERAKGALNHKHPFTKILIALAGPAFNLFLAVILYWFVFVAGKPDFPAILGTSTGEMQRAGFQQGDEIRRAGEADVRSWEDLGQALGMAAAYKRDLTMSGVSKDGVPFERVVRLSNLPANGTELEQYKAIGFAFDDQPIAHVAPEADQPAAKAGIQAGDRFVAVNGRPVDRYRTFIDAIQEEGAKGGALTLDVLRAGKIVAVEVTPRVDLQDGKSVYRIGVPTGRPRSVVTRYGPIDAIGKAVKKTVDSSVQTVVILKDILARLLPANQISGPITIARVAEMAADDGFVAFIGLLAAISVGLAILNLLPVPILDGGHILYYSIEWIRGRTLTVRELEAGQVVGLAMVVGLVGLAFYNDFARLLQ